MASSYVVNLDEIEVIIEGVKVQVKGIDELEEMLKDHFDNLMDLLLKFLKPYNCSKVIDMSKHIPAIKNDFKISTQFEQEVYISGVTFSQTGWKCEDEITFKVNDTVIIDKIHTKELGQNKSFAALVKVNAGDVVSVIYHNNSGNSKMFYCDLNFLYRKE